MFLRIPVRMPARGARDSALHESRFSAVRAGRAPHGRRPTHAAGFALLLAALLPPAALADGAPEPASAAPARAPRVSSPPSLYRPGNTPPLVRPKPASPTTPGVDPEARAPGIVARVWLNRPFSGLGGPERLTPIEAARLRSAARAAGVDWALLLGVLRASHAGRQSTVTGAEAHRVGAQLRKLGARAHSRLAATRLLGSRALADQALALAGYYRAVGLDSLVSGLDAAKGRLIGRVFRDKRIDVGLVDEENVAAGRVDVRVLASVLYLAEEFGQVRVSSLLADHHVVRPGVASAHMSGLAFDVSALGGRSFFDRPRLAARAARSFLLLPAELRPQQLISVASERGDLLASGERPDHLHVGF